MYDFGDSFLREHSASTASFGNLPLPMDGRAYSLWCSWRWCSLNRGHLDPSPWVPPESCRLKNKSNCDRRTATCLPFSEIMHGVLLLLFVSKLNVNWEAASYQSGDVHTLLRPPCCLMHICVILSTGSGRDRKRRCVTHRGGCSCICFYSCFLASGLLSGDKAVCTPAAEVPGSRRRERN